MERKAIIEISLVEECYEKTNQELANDIFKELSEGLTLISWCKQVNKVIVTEGYE